ncbi:hypothetical protein KKI23_02670 [Patescibacteria group bacterium]|nr:hypothetical protein [Patescibacteria group bacterium]
MKIKIYKSLPRYLSITALASFIFGAIIAFTDLDQASWFFLVTVALWLAAKYLQKQISFSEKESKPENK